MNTYKITKLDEKTVDVTFTVDAVATSDKFDSRFMPIRDAEALDIELNRILESLETAVVEPIPQEVLDMVNVTKDVKVKV